MGVIRYVLHSAWRRFLPPLFALALASTIPLVSALGCEGKKTIFEDNFADTSGGWSLGPDVKIENSSLVIKPPRRQNIKSINVTNTLKSPPF